MGIERCTIDIRSTLYSQMYERVQAGGGRCAADELTPSRKSTDVHLPGTGTSCGDREGLTCWTAKAPEWQSIMRTPDRVCLCAGPGVH